MTKTEHINCGGELIPYTPTEAELITLNRFFKKEHQPTIQYYIKDKQVVLLDKNVFRCDNCKYIIRVLTMFSYNDYVEMGEIKKVE
jgi:hypothetical protein